MSFLANLVSSLSGYKTYIVCLAGILTALGAYLNKSISLTDFVQAVFVSIGGITMRAGVSKSGPSQ